MFAGSEFSVGGLLNTDKVTSASLSSSGAAAGASVNGSPYSIVVTNAVGTGLTNYTISYVNGQLTVNAATLTVAASNTNRVYGAANPVFTASYAGFVNGDTTNVLSGSLGNLSTVATATSPVGTYTITNTPGTLGATNYSINYTNGVLMVTPAALTVTASNLSKTYGQAVVFAGTEFSTSGLLNGDSVTGASLSSPGVAAGAGVGGSPYNIAVTNAVGTGLTNYSISYVNGQLTVTPATLTVTANATNRNYGVANPVFTASYGGFLNGDTVSVSGRQSKSDDSGDDGQSSGRLFHIGQRRDFERRKLPFSLINGTLTVNQAD